MDPVIESNDKPKIEDNPRLKPDPLKDPMFFQCPHCDGELIIFPNEVNCGIFRHANLKSGGQVNPHSKKEVCDKLVAEDKVDGCCKPFQLKKNSEGKYEISECGYI